MSGAPPKPQPTIIAGPSGDLEALIEEPADFRRDVFGVVCHPHPLGGGTLTNKVVHTLARAMNKRGAPTLRFNFRGVGQSAGSFDNGVGEMADALAVIAAGRLRWPAAALWLAGFSFGSYVALQAAAGAQANKLITVAPPVGRWELGTLTRPSCPWLIVQGDSDELVESQAVAAWAATFKPPPQFELLAGVGHFFHGQLHELDRLVSAFLQRQ